MRQHDKHVENSASMTKPFVRSIFRRYVAIYNKTFFTLETPNDAILYDLK